MSLDAIKVTIDDELVTIEDRTDNIDIYLREGIHQSRQAEVTYELVKYFKERIGFDKNITPFISLLMGASIHSLPEILNKHNISLPEGLHDGIDELSGEENSDPEDDNPLAEGGNIQSNLHDGSHDSRGDNVSSREDPPSDGTVFAPAESGTGTDAGRSSRYSYPPRAARRDHPTPLRELIPSHQSRSQGIVQRASNFRLSNAEAAAPIQHHSESGAAPLHFTRSVKARLARSNGDESEYSSSPRMSATEGPYHRSLNGGYGAGGGNSSVTIRPVSSGATQGGRADDPSEIRARGVGYLGELFVSSIIPEIIDPMANPGNYNKKVFEMFNQQIDDWTFECWTSRLRAEAGHPRFEGHEGDFSDFTYVDTSGRMRAALRDAGVVSNAAWSNATKFHLEVKSTLGPCAEPMFVSQNQVDKVCICSI